MKTNKAWLLAALALASLCGCLRSHAQSGLVGITSDSEYLLFVVDSSGSMRRYEWDRVIHVVRETFAMYPEAEGLQVLSDQGSELIASYRGAWIPNTLANQEQILEQLESWEATSTSNPHRGLIAALDRYYDPEKSIALYLLSDDFSPGAGGIAGLVAEVDARRNSILAAGVPRVRIHSVAFPVFYDQLGPGPFATSTGAAVAILMSTLSQRNDGRFLALSSRPATVAATATAASGAADASAADANRVLIVVDTSANMRPSWPQAIDTVEWLLDESGDGNSYQVLQLTSPARSVVPGSQGQWLSNADGSLGERVVAGLRDLTPAGPVDFGEVASVVRGLEQAPDHVYVLAASDPGIAGPQDFPRVELAGLGDAPIDVLLFGAGAAPQAVPFYWMLALSGGGSLVAPANDWP